MKANAARVRRGTRTSACSTRLVGLFGLLAVATARRCDQAVVLKTAADVRSFNEAECEAVPHLSIVWEDVSKVVSIRHLRAVTGSLRVDVAPEAVGSEIFVTFPRLISVNTDIIVHARKNTVRGRLASAETWTPANCSGCGACLEAEASHSILMADPLAELPAAPRLALRSKPHGLRIAFVFSSAASFHHRAWGRLCVLGETSPIPGRYPSRQTRKECAASTCGQASPWIQRLGKCGSIRADGPIFNDKTNCHYFAVLSRYHLTVLTLCV